MTLRKECASSSPLMEKSCLIYGKKECPYKKASVQRKNSPKNEIPSIKLTYTLKIGRAPKGNDRIPTIHFSGAMLVSGRVSPTNACLHNLTAQILWHYADLRVIGVSVHPKTKKRIYLYKHYIYRYINISLEVL